MSTSKKYRVLLLFGPPGSGKGTQGRILGEIPGLHHLATGDMFRGLDPESSLGRRVRTYSSKGELVPDELTIELWQDHVAKEVADGAYDPGTMLLVLDGIPRSPAQAAAMDGLIDVQAIVHLEPDSIDNMVQRMKKRALQEGRGDDADEGVIRRRFEVYEQETAPVLAQYPAKLVHGVCAMGSPLEVLGRVLDVIVPVYAGKFGNPLG